MPSDSKRSSFARKPEFEPGLMIEALQRLAARRDWVTYEHVKKNGVPDAGESGNESPQILVAGRIATEMETTTSAKQFAAYCVQRGMQAKIGYAESMVPSRSKSAGSKRQARVWVDAQHGTQLRVTATWVCRNADAAKRAYTSEGVVLKSHGLGRLDLSITEFKQMGKQ
jgi:predicted DNA-binding helix-hairpin-helix protein